MFLFLDTCRIEFQGSRDYCPLIDGREVCEDSLSPSFPITAGTMNVEFAMASFESTTVGQ